MSAEFDLAGVEAALAGTRFAGQLRHLLSVGSTSTLALASAAAGAETGVWVADEQTAGRGRGGHTWHSAAGDGLYVSVLVRPRVSLAEAPKITLATGLAAQSAIRQVSGLAPDIRWPNDLLFGDRKCGGILVESAAEPDRSGLRYAVIGVGINVAHTEFPGDLRGRATSLRIEAGKRIRREDLLIALLRELALELTRLESAEPDLLSRFGSASSWISGKRVRVGEGDGYTGWTCGLDQDGFLLVTDDAGLVRTVRSGGVRPA